MSDLQTPETLTYMQAMKRLEQIVEDLNNPDLELEKAMSLFQEGLKLSQFCQEKLDHFEKEMNTLIDEEKSA